MANHQRETAAGTAAGAATARALEPIAESVGAFPAPTYEEIAQLAYQYWQERGCPHGSPDEDWLKAEVQLQKQASGT